MFWEMLSFQKLLNLLQGLKIKLGPILYLIQAFSMFTDKTELLTYCLSLGKVQSSK